MGNFKKISSYEKQKLIQTCKQLHKWKNNKDASIRQLLAKQGFFLEEYKNDEDISVVGQVALKGYALHYFKNHKSPLIRRIVAFQGYGLNELLNDEDEGVRFMAEHSKKAKEEYGTIINQYGFEVINYPEHFDLHMSGDGGLK